MSATPIPRTLEMAVTGIREMSTLATPPEDRHPILTYVGARSASQITAAIRRELLREGQIFYVHNRVSSIQRIASEIAELVPEARVGVAHGQMGEHQLEQVMVDFWERKYDVLVSTTIIETGLDIANANTLIVDRADKYGLSQLHQLRGRVGRGRERAYAYFLYDSEKPLSELAVDRLETIAANNDLGSGMQVALKDLEIRGAGNLLGGEQSGHIAGVGFDLYLRMIGEAVSDFRGEVADGQTELRLEIPVDARIPEHYIDSERLRLEAYQKLSAAAGPASAEGRIDLVLEELVDRYGKAPEEVEALVRISKLRRIAQQAGLSDVVALPQVPPHRAGRPARLDAGAPAAHVPGRAHPGRRGERAVAADRGGAARGHRADRVGPAAARRDLGQGPAARRLIRVGPLAAGCGASAGEPRHRMRRGAVPADEQLRERDELVLADLDRGIVVDDLEPVVLVEDHVDFDVVDTPLLAEPGDQGERQPGLAPVLDPAVLRAVHGDEYGGIAGREHGAGVRARRAVVGVLRVELGERLRRPECRRGLRRGRQRAELGAGRDRGALHTGWPRCGGLRRGLSRWRATRGSRATPRCTRRGRASGGARDRGGRERRIGGGSCR